jgi:hypothetical protein
MIQNSRWGWLLDFRHRSYVDTGRKDRKLRVRILFMKNYMFKLVRKNSNFSGVLRRFDTAQDVQHSVIGSVNSSGHSLIALFAKFTRSLTTHPPVPYDYIVVRLFGFCPSCLNSFSCALASLFRCEFSGPRWTAFLAALSPQSDGSGIFRSFCHSHNRIIRERSRLIHRAELSDSLFFQAAVNPVEHPNRAV